MYQSCLLSLSLVMITYAVHWWCHLLGENQWQSRKRFLLQVGKTKRWWWSCQQSVNLLTVDQSLSHVHSLLFCVTSIWVEWTEAINSGGTTSAERWAGSSIYHFLFDVTVTNSILQKNFCPGMKMNMKEFRRPAMICPLPLRHFPVKVNADDSAKRRGRCAQCYKTKHSRLDTSWYCRECYVWLCHTGDASSDCFLSWHTHNPNSNHLSHAYHTTTGSVGPSP